MTGYQLDIATDNDFNYIVFTTDELTDTIYVFTGIEDNLLYYWRVRPENASDRGSCRDIWSFSTIIVGVKDGREILEVYSLIQNYHNPFNPLTTIRYGLPKQSSVKFEVYNTLGQRIATLIDGAHYTAGTYEAIWDARDESGNEVTSGFYLYRISASDYRQVKKNVTHEVTFNTKDPGHISR